MGSGSVNYFPLTSVTMAQCGILSSHFAAVYFDFLLPHSFA